MGVKAAQGGVREAIPPITPPWLTNQSAELEYLFYSNVESVSYAEYFYPSADRMVRSGHGGRVE